MWFKNGNEEVLSFLPLEVKMQLGATLEGFPFVAWFSVAMPSTTQEIYCASQ